MKCLTRFPRLLVVGLVLGSIVTPISAQSIDKFLPVDTEIVLTFNLQQILTSKLAKENDEIVTQGKFFLENALNDKGAKQYLEKAGIDLFRDIKSVTMAGPIDKDGEKSVIVVEGNFDATKIKAAAEVAAKETGDALKIQTEGPRTIYQISPDVDKTVYVTILNATQALVAMNKDGLKSALERTTSGQKSEQKKSFAALLNTTNDKQSFSLVASGPAIVKMLENIPGGTPPQAAEIVKTIEGVSLIVTVSKDLSFELGLNANDAKGAKQFAQLGNMGLGFARTAIESKAQDDPKFAPLVEAARSLRVVVTGNNVSIRGEISNEAINKLKANPPR